MRKPTPIRLSLKPRAEAPLPSANRANKLVEARAPRRGENSSHDPAKMDDLYPQRFYKATARDGSSVRQTDRL